MEPIQWTLNTLPKSDDKWLSVMDCTITDQARAFHRSFPQYAVTPLVSLQEMAKLLGVGGLWIKDESYRFGLNAFKVLGGSFAMARYIARQTGRDVSEMSYNYLTSEALKRDFGQATFFTATDGNHGRGVAWSAKRLGQKAVVHMPKGTRQSRFDNIAKEGAQVTIEEVNYDACVRMAAAEAAETPNGVLIQDTAWDGYEEIPGWIMQGYGTMAAEADEQLGRAPTHIFLQAGVGSMAAAVQGWFVNRYPDTPPKVIVVEATAADCFYRSAVAGDGAPYASKGDLNTIMAGLACGEPSTVAWDILRNHAAGFVACPDWVSALGMRLLAAPAKGDSPVTSGESGAACMGLLAAIMTDGSYAELRHALELDEHSRVLLFSTEGDTDPERYKNIVWGGAYPVV